MIDYYDRLETQLAELTAKGAHRGRRTWRGGLPRMRLGLVAVVAAVLLVVAVGAVLLSAGTSHRPSHQVTTLRHGPPGRPQLLPGGASSSVRAAHMQRRSGAAGYPSRHRAGSSRHGDRVQQASHRVRVHHHRDRLEAERGGKCVRRVGPTGRVAHVGRLPGDQARDAPASRRHQAWSRQQRKAGRSRRRPRERSSGPGAGADAPTARIPQPTRADRALGVRSPLMGPEG